ncbi:alginate biosynthesis protein AlgA [Betaproteobacteria bacterium]|nr:alginate biosynthesis protein AlgA [Betaproteobacteria bacterium]GHU03771.1 alginate biosynthesis protein AlgA [Betaproteobacteria bacterium]GHU21798.1 alginate biosynthesis protein AlgA [Betaproteobacteria bacterium]
MIPVILSGGSGSRLWPLSREQFPKQFHALTGEHSLFQQTLERLSGGDMQPPLVVCNRNHRFIVQAQLDALKLATQGIVFEPFGRNTAPAVAIAAMKLLADGRDELLLVLPADHVLENVDVFRSTVLQAGVAAEQGELVLFGIPASRPETGYGYIKTGGSQGLPEGVLRVERFIEKPNAEKAADFVASGDYFWNSGMFLFRASRIVEELKKHDAYIYEKCIETLECSSHSGDNVEIDELVFAECPDNSIDYAVMEKTERACVMPLDAGWNDVGSWSSIWDAHEKDDDGNVVRGDVVLQNSRNCLVQSSGKLVSVVGLDDVVVVDTGDATMVAHRDCAQDVKELVGHLKAQGRKETDNHREVFRPWGSYDSVDMGSRFQVKRITVKPGAQLSLQMHHHRAEHWIVVSGTAQVTCDDKIFLLSENQSTYIPIASVHRLANPGKIPLEIIEVQSGSYLGEDDITRLDDVYGRTGEAVAQK